jgi:hypothetical protein
MKEISKKAIERSNRISEQYYQKYEDNILGDLDWDEESV